MEYISQNEDIKRKKCRTCLSKYGVGFPLQSPEIFAKAVSTNIKRYGAKMPIQNHDIFKKSKNRYEYNGIKFDTKPELAMYIWLTDNKIPFEYQPDTFFEYSDGKRTRRYFPDFKIQDVFYEIKGDHFFDKNGMMCNPYDHSKDYIYAAKYRCILDNNIKLIRTAEYMKYVKYVQHKYGYKFLDQFKRR